MSKNNSKSTKEREFKNKLDKFKNKIIKEYKKEVLGITLLPPRKEEKNKINILIVLDDSKSKKIPDYKLKDKISPDLIKIANSIDQNLWLELKRKNLYFRPKTIEKFICSIIKDSKKGL